MVSGRAPVTESCDSRLPKFIMDSSQMAGGMTSPMTDADIWIDLIGWLAQRTGITAVESLTGTIHSSESWPSFDACPRGDDGRHPSDHACHQGQKARNESHRRSPRTPPRSSVQRCLDPLGRGSARSCGSPRRWPPRRRRRLCRLLTRSTPRDGDRRPVSSPPPSLACSEPRSPRCRPPRHRPMVLVQPRQALNPWPESSPR